MKKFAFYSYSISVQIGFVEKIIVNAYAKRAQFMDEGTSAIRVFDGAGDGYSGVSIDVYDGAWLVATQFSNRPVEFLTALENVREQEKSIKSIYWKQLSQSQKESPLFISGEKKDMAFLAKESGVIYEIDFNAGYSQGIFLDQRENRKRVNKRVSKQDKVLNTFAYTGAFSVSAALAGATTTTLDLSQPYLDWGKRNFTHNKMSPDDHHWCKGDTFKWLERFAKQGRKFEGIILDPPTFSRDAKGKVFRVERDYSKLVELALSCVQKNGWLLASTNCRKLTEKDFLNMVKLGGGVGKNYKTFPMPNEYRDDVAFLRTVWVDC